MLFSVIVCFSFDISVISARVTYSVTASLAPWMTGLPMADGKTLVFLVQCHLSDVLVGPPETVVVTPGRVRQVGNFAWVLGTR